MRLVQLHLHRFLMIKIYLSFGPRRMNVMYVFLLKLVILMKRNTLFIKKKKERQGKKRRNKVNQEFVFTMDLQSLLLSPKSNVSIMYYKTKLAVHNFTIYNLRSKDTFCYLWNETEGGLTSNEFSSIISNFILENIPLNTCTKIIFSIVMLYIPEQEG